MNGTTTLDATTVSLAEARAVWYARQGLAERRTGSPADLVAATGWLRTFGGNAYVGCRARLLDFHLAQGPLAAGPPPMRIGGTPGYMAPEQARALEALRQGRPIPQAVDGRADLFALGVVLAEVVGAAASVAAEVKYLRILLSHLSVPKVRRTLKTEVSIW